MYVRNVDEKVVAVTIQDTEIMRLNHIVHDCTRVLELRKSFEEK